MITDKEIRAMKSLASEVLNSAISEGDRSFIMNQTVFNFWVDIAQVRPGRVVELINAKWKENHPQVAYLSHAAISEQLEVYLRMNEGQLELRDVAEDWNVNFYKLKEFCRKKGIQMRHSNKATSLTEADKTYILNHPECSAAQLAERLAVKPDTLYKFCRKNGFSIKELKK